MPHTLTFDTHENVADLLSEQLVSRQYLDERLRELEYRLIIRIGAMLVVVIGVIATLVKMF